MIWILVAMLGIIVLAVLVVLYVAYPHRGEEVPNAPWVGDAMRKGVNLLPDAGQPVRRAEVRHPPAGRSSTTEHARSMPGRAGPCDGIPAWLTTST